MPVQRFSALQSLYGGRTPRPWSRSRGAMTERLFMPQKPRTPRTPRMPHSLPPPGPRKQVAGGFYSQARRQVRHLAALSAESSAAVPVGLVGVTNLAATAPPVTSTGGASTGLQGLLAGAVASREDDPALAGSDLLTIAAADVAPTTRLAAPVRGPSQDQRHLSKRVTRDLAMPKPSTPLPPPLRLPSTRWAPPDFRNSVCPFSQRSIEEGIVLNCGHRFSVEHLGTAIGSSQHMEIAPAGFLVCPLCGDAQRYCPGPEKAGSASFSHSFCPATGRELHPTIYSDTKRAFHGSTLTRNWDVETTLPANV